MDKKGIWYIILNKIKRKIIDIPNLRWTFLEDIGANNLIPEGVKESRIICENKPKNKAATISIYEISQAGNTNIEMKNNGIKIIKTFLLKNKKLKRTTNIAINK